MDARSDALWMDRYRTATALPFPHLHDATSALCLDLRHRMMDGDESRVPDWSTLRVVGPYEVFDRTGTVRFEYRASVLPRLVDVRPNVRRSGAGLTEPVSA